MSLLSVEKEELTDCKTGGHAFFALTDDVSGRGLELFRLLFGTGNAERVATATLVAAEVGGIA
jgi:hypothetical protein